MKSILIIRPSAIGDIVMASPMIRVLREAYPRAHLAWLAEPPLQELLRHNPALDEVICWPKGRWKGLLRQRKFLLLKSEASAFAGRMRLRKFDLALDVQGLLRSRWLARISGARTRIGFDSKEPGRFLMTRVVSRGSDSEEMGSEYRHMMQVLGFSTGDFHPEIVLSPEDERMAAQVVEANKIGGEYAVFAPFTTRPQKHWFEDRWADLAKSIRTRLHMPVILLGGPGDAEKAKAIEEKAPKGLLNLAGRTSLSQGAAIIKQAALLVGVDTGLTHMGAAFDCPTVALFGATCPYLRTAGKKTLVTYNKTPCSPCRRRPTCNGDFTCMRSIETGQAFDAALKLLEAE